MFILKFTLNVLLKLRTKVFLVFKPVHTLQSYAKFMTILVCAGYN